MAIEMDCE